MVLASERCTQTVRPSALLARAPLCSQPSALIRGIPSTAVTGLSVGLGINLGLATLCAQAYGAGRAAADNGLHLRRCHAILAFALVYASVAAWFAEPLLRALGQPGPVAECSARRAASTRRESTRPAACAGMRSSPSVYFYTFFLASVQACVGGSFMTGTGSLPARQVRAGTARWRAILLVGNCHSDRL
jgi:hypothetical protein